MWNLMAVLALAVGAPVHVTATKLDGTSKAGRLESWSGDQIVLVSGREQMPLPKSELLALEFSAEPTGDEGAPQVELVDGSVLPLASYGTSGKLAEVLLRAPGDAATEPLTFEIKKVKSVRLQAIAPDVLSQWREIRALAAPSDLIVVAKRGGKSLDHMECVLGEVTASEITFELDGEQMRVPRNKVAGLIYYRGFDASNEPAPLVVIGPDGLRLVAMSVNWQKDGDLAAKTQAGVPVSWPIAGISSIDLSAGKVQFLSDMEPVATSWQPLVGLPMKSSRAAKFGHVRFNRSVSGGPLTLAFPNADPIAGSVQMKTYKKGLAARSRTELVYRLPPGYQRFLAEAGIEPATAASGSVMLHIFGDDRLLVEHPIDGASAPVPLDLDVVDVKRLRIVVDYGENLDTGDWLNLCNARVVK